MDEKLSVFKFITRQRNQTPNIFEYANDKRRDGIFNDVTIKIGNKLFPANRMILSCCSEVFEKMFLSEMKEKYEDEIELKDVDESSMRKIIDFIYTGRITIDDDEDAINLLSTAEYFQLNEVKSFCSEYLESVITFDNCFIIHTVANVYRLDKLKEKTNEFISSNLNKVSQTMDYKTLSKQELKLLCCNLDRTQASETSIYEALITWLKHDEQNRQSEVDDFFQFIDFSKFSFDYLNDVICNETMITNSQSSFSILIKAIYIINKRNKMKESGYKILSINCNRTLTNVLEIINIFDETPKQYPDLPLPMRDHCSIKIDDIVFCFGKSDNWYLGENYNRMWKMKLNAPKFVWEESAPMNTKRHWFAAANLQNQIVITGGYDGDQIVNSTEVYTLAFNQWLKVFSLQTARHSHCMAMCKNKLYAIGGADQIHQSLSSVEQLTGLKREWKYVKPMRTARKNFAAVSLDDFIYAIGGSNDSENIVLKSVETYDPSNDEWSYSQDLNRARKLFDACVLHGKIYAVGGLDSDCNCVKEIECYNPETNNWTIVAETEHELISHSLITV